MESSVFWLGIVLPVGFVILIGILAYHSEKRDIEKAITSFEPLIGLIVEKSILSFKTRKRVPNNTTKKSSQCVFTQNVHCPQNCNRKNNG